MNIKHSELEITRENPFGNCKLSRKKYADILTNIINSYPFGFVLAINNRWGTGKTTFVKMWEQELKNNEHQTVYFNAWENDFEDNPLTALMGELKTLATESTQSKFKVTLKKAATLSKHILPIIAQSIADKYIDTKGIKEAIVGISEGMSEVFENDVKEYAEKKKSISEFRTNLSEFIASTYKGKPLIFIVDELDRCRPNYAISILEQIKHFFAVPNIIFVLSIDKVQLGNAVKGVYGSDSIDSEEYLRRFIDLEYSIPEPEFDVYYKYLFDYFDFKDFFNANERLKYPELQSDSQNFLRVSKLLFIGRNIPLRQQEKIFGLARIALRSFRQNEYVVPHIFLFLAFLKITNIKLYQDLKNKNLSIIQVQKKYFEIIESNIARDTEHELLWIEAYLVTFYHNYIETSYSRDKLYKFNTETNANELIIDSIMGIEKNTNFLNILVDMNRGRSEGELNLGYFLSRLELLEEIKQ